MPPLKRLLCCFKPFGSVVVEQRDPPEAPQLKVATDGAEPAIHKYLALMLQHILDPVALFSRHGTLLANNEASAALFERMRHGRRSTQCYGYSYTEGPSLQLLFASDAAALEEAVRAVESGRTWRGLLNIPARPALNAGASSATPNPTFLSTSTSSCASAHHAIPATAASCRTRSQPFDASSHSAGCAAACLPHAQAQAHGHSQIPLHRGFRYQRSASEAAGAVQSRGASASGHLAGGGSLRESSCRPERRSELLVDVLMGSVHGREPSARQARDGTQQGFASQGQTQIQIQQPQQSQQSQQSQESQQSQQSHSHRSLPCRSCSSGCCNANGGSCNAANGGSGNAATVQSISKSGMLHTGFGAAAVPASGGSGSCHPAVNGGRRRASVDAAVQSSSRSASAVPGSGGDAGGGGGGFPWQASSAHAPEQPLHRAPKSSTSPPLSSRPASAVSVARPSRPSLDIQGFLRKAEMNYRMSPSTAAPPVLLVAAAPRQRRCSESSAAAPAALPPTSAQAPVTLTALLHSTDGEGSSAADSTAARSRHPSSRWAALPPPPLPPPAGSAPSSHHAFASHHGDGRSHGGTRSPLSGISRMAPRRASVDLSTPTPLVRPASWATTASGAARINHSPAGRSSLYHQSHSQLPVQARAPHRRRLSHLQLQLQRAFASADAADGAGTGAGVGVGAGTAAGAASPAESGGELRLATPQQDPAGSAGTGLCGRGDYHASSRRPSWAIGDVYMPAMSAAAPTAAAASPADGADARPNTFLAVNTGVGQTFESAAVAGIRHYGFPIAAEQHNHHHHHHHHQQQQQQQQQQWPNAIAAASETSATPKSPPMAYDKLSYASWAEESQEREAQSGQEMTNHLVGAGSHGSERDPHGPQERSSLSLTPGDYNRLKGGGAGDAGGAPDGVVPGAHAPSQAGAALPCGRAAGALVAAALAAAGADRPTRGSRGSAHQTRTSLLSAALAASGIAGSGRGSTGGSGGGGGGAAADTRITITGSAGGSAASSPATGQEASLLWLSASRPAAILRRSSSPLGTSPRPSSPHDVPPPATAIAAVAAIPPNAVPGFGPPSASAAIPGPTSAGSAATGVGWEFGPVAPSQHGPSQASAPWAAPGESAPYFGVSCHPPPCGPVSISATTASWSLAEPGANPCEPASGSVPTASSAPRRSSVPIPAAVTSAAAATSACCCPLGSALSSSGTPFTPGAGSPLAAAAAADDNHLLWTSASNVMEMQLMSADPQEQLLQGLSTSTWGTLAGGRVRSKSPCTGSAAGGGGAAAAMPRRNNASFVDASNTSPLSPCSNYVACDGGSGMAPEVCGDAGGGGPRGCGDVPISPRGVNPTVPAPGGGLPSAAAIAQAPRSVHFPVSRHRGYQSDLPCTPKASAYALFGDAAATPATTTAYSTNSGRGSASPFLVIGDGADGPGSGSIGCLGIAGGGSGGGTGGGVALTRSNDQLNMQGPTPDGTATAAPPQRALRRNHTSQQIRNMPGGGVDVYGSVGVEAAASLRRSNTPPSRSPSASRHTAGGFSGSVKLALPASNLGGSGSGSAVPRIVHLTMRSMAKVGASLGAPPMRVGPVAVGDAARTVTSPTSSGSVRPMEASARGSPRGGGMAAATGMNLYGSSPGVYHDIAAAAAAAAAAVAADASCHGGAASSAMTAAWEANASAHGFGSQPFGSTLYAGFSTDQVGGSGAVAGNTAALAAVVRRSTTQGRASEGFFACAYPCSAQGPSSDWLLSGNSSAVGGSGGGTAAAGAAAVGAGAAGGVRDASRRSTVGGLPPAMCHVPASGGGAEVGCGSPVVSEALPAVAGGGVHEGGSWYEVVVSGMPHPATGDLLLLVVQHDVSARVWAERQLARVVEAEHLLLESIFPQHVLEHIAVMASTAALPGAGPAAAAAVGSEPPELGSDGIALAPPRPLSPPPGAFQPPPITGDTFLHLATSHSALTVLFCDIQGFTSMCGVVKPATVMAFLNDLYTRLDAMLDAFGVYKVETIGDCYVAAGGLMKVDEETGAVTVRSHDVDPQHAHRTVQFAKALLRAASSVRLPTTGEPVRLRVGVHSGPAMSGVVGTRMPRFCLFGDTINTASRMESTGQPGAIHVSQATRDLAPGEDWRPTGGVQAKGKGLLETYLLRP